MLKLEEIIRERIKDMGPITFAEYMEMALYHHLYGYYMKDDNKIGSRGDFYTSPIVSPLFGEMLARQLNDLWLQIGAPKEFIVFEFGAGTGLMAAHILGYIESDYRDLYNTLKYNIIEISPSMKDIQETVLHNHKISSKRVGWYDSIDMYKKTFTGCVLSNEFIDALPFHRVKKQNGELLEIYVNCTDSGLCEELGKLSTQALKQYFSDQNIDLGEGYYAEVNLNALSWIAEVARNLEEGLVITVDYGYVASELYNGLRRNGTMRCFKEHSLSISPYQLPGTQDITASINFSALMEEGKKFGLKTMGLISQQEFLLNLGIMDFLQEQTSFQYDRKVLKKTLAAKQLIMPQGMGLDFKVLVQGRNLSHVKLKSLTKYEGRSL